VAALRFRAAALAAGLVGWSALIGPRLPARVQPGVHAVLDRGEFVIEGFKEEEARAIAKGLVGRQ